MSSVFTGLVLIIVCSIFMGGRLTYMLVRVKNKLIKTADRVYKNKKTILTLYILFFIIIPIIFAAAVTLAVLTLKQNDLNIDSDNKLKNLKLAFNITYLTYVFLILVSLMLIERAFKVMIVFEKDQIYYFLDGKKISKNSIVTISHNVKRTILIISYTDGDGKRDAYIMKYNFRLKDWFKNE